MPRWLIYYIISFKPLEVVSRYRDPQTQVVENESYLFNLCTNNCISWCLDTHSISNNSNFLKQIKNDTSRDQQDHG